MNQKASTAEVMALIEKIGKTPEGKVVVQEPFPHEPWQPKRLTPKHRQILSLYAQSMKREDVASLCKCTPALVTMLAKCDLGRAYLKEIEETMDQRLRLLQHKTIDAIEDQLDNGKGENKLKAAALQMRATGKLGHDPREGEDTAEDVIQRILQIAGDVNIQVNNPPPAKALDAPNKDI